MDLAARLRSLIKGKVLSDNQALAFYSRDASLFEVHPQAVAVVEDVNDIKALVRFASEHVSENISVTVRAGGTDMTGGPLNESIILDINNLNHLVGVGHQQAVVQPGMYYRDFEEATLAKGLLLPTFPASRQLCTVGGMVANNAGGEKSLVYGQTVRYVHEVKAVLADGNEYTFGPVTRTEADRKAREDSLEGRMYREMLSLVTENYKLIYQSRPRVSKNSAGYQLWDIWDGTTFNLAKVFAGSQGTLGIVTQITFDLVRPKPRSRLLVAFLKDRARLPAVVAKIQKFIPESLEAYDDKTLSLAVRFFKEFIVIAGAKNIFSLAWRFLPEAWMVLTGGVPSMVVLAEFTGDIEHEVAARTQEAVAALRGSASKVKIVSSPAEMQKYWAIRRESFNLLRHHLRNLQTAPFIDDVIVPREKVSEFLPALEKILAPYHLLYSMVGHVGNGNFHVIPLVDINSRDIRAAIPRIAKEVYNLVIAMGGSITAEHNDGLIRTPFLEKMYGSAMYELFKKVKNIFDPQNIFNPGKKVNGSWDYAMDHIKHDPQSYQW